MAHLRKQNQTAHPLQFLMVLTSDHLTGATGKTPAVKLSKNGATGAAPAGAITEIDATNNPGWYQVAGNATDSNTLGPLILSATAALCDPTDGDFQVVAFDPDDAVRIGLTALPNVTANASGGLPTIDASLRVSANVTAIGGTATTYDANNLLNVNVKDWNGTATTLLPLTDKAGYSLSGTQTFNVTGNVTGNVSGSVGSVTGSVGSVVAGVIVTTNNDKGGYTVTTVSDKTGYSLSGTQTFNTTGNITGNLSGSVGSVTGAVGSVTGTVGAALSVSGTVGAAASVTAPVTVGTNNDKTGYSLSASQTFSMSGNISGNISGNVSGSVGSVAGNVSGSVGSVSGTVGTTSGIASGGITSASFAAGSLAAAAFASGALNGKGDWLLATGYTAAPGTVAIQAAILSSTNTIFTDASGRVKALDSTGAAFTYLTPPTPPTVLQIQAGLVSSTNLLTINSLGQVDSSRVTGTTGAALSVTGSIGSVTGNVGGNVVGSVASVSGAVGSIAAGGITSASFASGSLPAASGIKKNAALAAFEFVMTDLTTHAPKTGVTVTATRSLDGAAFGACANAVAELSNGVYTINLAAADLNANVVTFRFTGTASDDLLATVITQP